MSRWQRISRAAGYRAFRFVFGRPGIDPALHWRGTAQDGLDVIRVLHLGGCELRSMTHGHDYRAPLGYPVVASERLLAHGVGMEFSRWFATRFEDLPDMEKLLPHVKLSGPPDVVWIQIGAGYFRRAITIDGPLTMELRDELGRRAQWATYPVYRFTRRLTRVLGRSTVSYHGTEALERFILEARRTWPEARIAVLMPFPGRPNTRASRRLGKRLVTDMVAACKRSGAEVVSFLDVLGIDPSLRCANGYNLNPRGSEAAGELLAEWLLSNRRAPDCARSPA
ncbi:MAG TPA: hypothetical protein VJU60_09270 [Thermoleophilaceae bacterium]|nr:hypothetical protein [Thermoleophilaceae bacterium]